MRIVVAIGIVVMAVATARAETPAPMAVALLPLDADQRLEIYGQPVAAEIARELTAGGIEVAIVGRKMAVPANARLVVDGTIKNSKGNTVTLSVRVRDPSDPSEATTGEPLAVIAPNMDSIDHAVEALVAKALPVIKSRLFAIAARDREKERQHADPPKLVAPAVAKLVPLVAAVSVHGDADTSVESLRSSLTTAIGPWAQRHRHEARPLDKTQLAGKDAAHKAVAAADADIGVWFEIQNLEVDTEKLPMARARVRVQVSDRSRIVFDRVVVTDTVLGGRNSTVEELSAIVAREVLAIVEPHVRRVIPGWWR